MTAPLLGQGREVGGVRGQGQWGHTPSDVEGLSLYLSQPPCSSTEVVVFLLTSTRDGREGLAPLSPIAWGDEIRVCPVEARRRPLAEKTKDFVTEEFHYET